jgi:hypothetical protein
VFGAADHRAMLTIDLHRGILVRVREGAGSTVTAHAGTVWLTEQDSLRDVLLRSGESFTLGRPGLALVQAFSDASISIDPTRGA